jgi:ankyrin repeat protein
LARNSDGQSALHRACYFGEILAVDWLLSNTQLKVKERDGKGNNSLHVACEGLNITLTRYLMQKVRDSESLLVANYEKHTPLDVLAATIESIAPQFK